MNNKKQQNIQSEKTLTEIFKYNAGGEASEYHIIIHSTKPEDTYEEQLNAVLNTYDYLLTQELKGAVAILKRAVRFFQQGFHILPHSFCLFADVAGIYHFAFVVDTCRS